MILRLVIVMFDHESRNLSQSIKKINQGVAGVTVTERVSNKQEQSLTWAAITVLVFCFDCYPSIAS